MSEHSIELLGQKFSYPTTWQGAFSVLVVCASITILVATLSPEQIKSIGIALGTESDREFESELVAINEKLSEENASLKEDIFRLTETTNISEPEKQKIVAKVEESEKELSKVYANVISRQLERKEMISAAIPNSNQQQQRVLSLEEARLVQQIGQLQQQQQQQQQQR